MSSGPRLSIPTPASGRFLSIGEVCARLGVTESTLRNWTDAGMNTRIAINLSAREFNARGDGGG